MTEFAKGDRVELHPATDAWMMGDRYGTVESFGPRAIRVRMDRSGRLRRIMPYNLTIIDTPNRERDDG